MSSLRSGVKESSKSLAKPNAFGRRLENVKRAQVSPAGFSTGYFGLTMAETRSAVVICLAS